jgi:hypothetical protein
VFYSMSDLPRKPVLPIRDDRPKVLMNAPRHYYYHGQLKTRNPVGSAMPRREFR